MEPASVEPVSPSQPEEALAEVQRLRHRAHERTHRGAWLPAAAIALLMLASIGLYRYPFGSPSSIEATYPFWAGLPDQQRSPTGSYVFWFTSAPFVFAVIAAWYQWRARRVGIRVSWRPFVVSGLGVLLLLAVLAAVPEGDPGPTNPDLLTPNPAWPGPLTPLVPVAVAVLLLAWAERSASLFVTGLWIAGLTLWLCSSWPLGSFPGWVDRLTGGGGPGLGGQLALRPGHHLVLMALPLLVFAVVRLTGQTLAVVRARR